MDTVAEAISRSNCSKDILYTFGASMTICLVQRNDAGARINAIRANNWQPESMLPATVLLTATDEECVAEGQADLAELAWDPIACAIETTFKGHGLTLLLEAVPEAQGQAADQKMGRPFGP